MSISIITPQDHQPSKEEIKKQQEELATKVKAFQGEIAEVCKKHGFEYFPHAQLAIRQLKEEQE